MGLPIVLGYISMEPLTFLEFHFFLWILQTLFNT